MAEESAPSPEDEAATEAGRLLFARPWNFVMGVAKLDQLPAPAPVEIAFAGRSNVGKSSLINALTSRKALARASNTPGRTRELNLFTPGEGLVLVDMPGYGYADAPKSEVDAWNRLVRDFLRGRASLRRVYLLIDARHGLKPNDLEVIKLLDQAAVSYQAVLTKADKVKPAQLDTVTGETAAALKKHPAAYPELIATSSETGAGIPALRATIAALRVR